MSKDRNVSIDLSGVFFIAFLVLKFGGHVYAATWSWWWVFFPVVPVLAVIFRAWGWM